MADDQVRRAAAAVEEYVVETKDWEKGTYHVEFNHKEGAMLVFWVVHSDDDKVVATGGGKSFAAYVDPVSNRVLKELHFQ